MAGSLSNAPGAAQAAGDHDRQRIATHRDRWDLTRVPHRRTETAIPVSYAVSGERSSPLWARNFAHGCGGRATNSNELQDGPVALFGSPARWDLLQTAIHDGREWYYGDHGLFTRYKYFRAVRNGLQHPGDGIARPPDRFERHGRTLAPQWRRDGKHIVICPNSAVYMIRFGIDAVRWTHELYAQLITLTDRPIRVRWKTDSGRRPLAADLVDAWMVIAFSSASAVEALMAGIPVCTLAPWASTARLGIQSLRDVERPHYPDIGERDQWLFNLAYQQWTFEEMYDGLAWRTLCENG